jgi:hypothetical protein
MDVMATVVRGPQYMRALERANEVRLARAELKRRVADGEARVADVVLTSPWEARSMAVADLLMSQRRWGRTRARRFLAGIPMSETKTIGSMTERQRKRVSEQLDELPAVPPAPEIAAVPAGEPLEAERELTAVCG